MLGLTEAGDRFGAALAIGNVDGIGDDGSSDEFLDASLRAKDLVIGHPGEAPDGLIGGPAGPAGAGQISVLLGKLSGSGLLSSLQYGQSTHLVD
jgi:hypothetical protein